MALRTIVITGASDGIGAAAAAQLAAGDVRLILIGRSAEKTLRIAQSLGVEHHVADYACLDEVRSLAAELRRTCDRIDVLANNAGALFKDRALTVDGYERTFQVDHLAGMLLTHELMDILVDSRASIVNTSSIAARLYARLDLNDLNTWRAFTPNRAYGNAKLANIIFTRGLHKRFRSRGVSAVAFHPGLVRTSFAAQARGYLHTLYTGAFSGFFDSPETAGERLRFFIEGNPKADWQPGEYYRAPGRIGLTKPQVYDPDIVAEHWDRCSQMLGIDW